MYYKVEHMGKGQSLGAFEQVVLLAILRVQASGAYGVSIRREITRCTQRQSSPGVVYTAFERLEEKGFVRSMLGEATAERGGRAKRYYEVTGQGLTALRNVQRDYQKLTEGLDLSGGVHA